MKDFLLATPVLLGITGKKRHGKGTFGAVARSRGFIEVNFADHLRELVSEINPIVSYPTDFEGMVPWRYNEVVNRYGYERAKDFFPEVVRTLQETGRSLRKADPDYFVKMWRVICLEKSFVPSPVHGALARPVVVTDVRFDNEAYAIQDLGGSVIQVIRPDFIFDAGQDQHESESGVSDHLVDYRIVTGSVEKLRELAGSFLDNMPELKNPINPNVRPVPVLAQPE